MAAPTRNCCIPSCNTRIRKYQGKKCFDRNTIILKNLIKQLQRRKGSLLFRLRNILSLSSNITTQKALGKFPSTAGILTHLRFLEVRKNKTVHRFTKEEIIRALALYNHGPRTYKWLRIFFSLPSPLTSNRIRSPASLHPAINEILFKELKKRVLKMKSSEKHCILLFDKVALSPQFKKTTNCVCGYDKKRKITDYAMVFMVRGIKTDFKYPISYTFYSSVTPAAKLASLITIVIRKLISIGFNIIGTVCNHSFTNMSAIYWLINTTRKNYQRQGKTLRHKIFEVDGHKIMPLYDPPNLMKGIRNNLLTKNLKYEMDGDEKMAKWDHIVQLYNENPSFNGEKLIPHLTEKHAMPEKISKMNVLYAIQVFSQRNGVYMGFFSNKGILPKECADTADLVISLDKLFDSVNGCKDDFREKGTEKPLLGPVTRTSGHSTVWKGAKHVLKTMKFYKNDKSGVVPSIKNWRQTIENLEYIVFVLFTKYKFRSLWMRNFNLDPLVEFLGCIRSHTYQTTPSCVAFEMSVASLLINKKILSK